MSAITLTRPLSDLRDDNRGAVMMTGLFMSCFLIGSLWFVVGIGDTLVFRDRMQEAADHGAFSSAALHAKGMNFISLCNLILLVGVTIHIILGIVHDIALGVCIFTLGFGCGFWGTMRRVYTTYSNSIFKPAARAIAVGQRVAALGYPWLGAAEAFQNGGKYQQGSGTSGIQVYALSSSLLPGDGALRNGAGNAPGQTQPGQLGNTVTKEGLPVERKPFNYLCKKIVNVVGNLFERALGISGGVAKHAADIAEGLIGGAIALRYCNDLGQGDSKQQSVQDKLNEGNTTIDDANDQIDKDNANRPKGDPPKDKINNVDLSKGGGKGGGGAIDPGFDPFWGDLGPMTVWGGASNGNPWMQIYAFNASPTMTDKSESRVGVSRGPKGGFQKYTTTEGGTTYWAQAEFYFDCNVGWDDPGCNQDDNATFAIAWRARLRRVTPPNVAEMFAGLTLEALYNAPGYRDLKAKLGAWGGLEVVFNKIEAEINKVATALTDKAQPGAAMYH